jgi:hypothetical protein
MIAPPPEMSEPRREIIAPRIEGGVHAREIIVLDLETSATPLRRIAQLCRIDRHRCRGDQTGELLLRNDGLGCVRP